ncbi:hypothetical protein DFQ14_1034 [Halopolyspora algeriensis]|uniref:Uncharacterized protein n=1 Tax=Halopolyspora algeriensis TaxID=1500506 RepID=A0A368VV32_9ACTN|nr:hypothetical protein DFQ14_1034 [Halopolyspora algeriensis]TQM53232.1 hypothetical protein FHU43_2618 [Halopolyspora algeriensis]
MRRNTGALADSCSGLAHHRNPACSGTRTPESGRTGNVDRCGEAELRTGQALAGGRSTSWLR